MIKKQDCILCGADSAFFAMCRNIVYYRCLKCMSVFMAPDFHPFPEREKERYESHNNDIDDPGYRNFVSPLVNEVLEKFTVSSRGLDFGSGTGPVAASVLREQGYNVGLYDPFFSNDRQKLNTTYDYILCCEVMEHFHNPASEFRLLRSLINQRGGLICMTELYREDIDFLKWRYKDDETHVFFYHPKSLEWIKSEYSFSSLELKDKVISLFV